MVAKLEFRHAYYSDPNRRAPLNRLAHEVFGLDFSPWNELGFEFPEYTPFTFFEGEEAVANVSASPMHLIVNGDPIAGVQLGTVCSHPDRRRIGLVRDLIDRAHRYWEDRIDCQFLFANERVLDFYQQFGYRQIGQSRFQAPAPSCERYSSRSRFCRLEDLADLEFLQELANDRTPVSLRCGVIRQAWLWLFHARTVYPDRLRWIPELGVVTLSYQEGPCLHLVDIVGPSIPPLAALYPYIGSEEIERIEFHFVPDRLDARNVEVLDDPESHLFVRGEFPEIRGGFRFPETAEA